MTYIKSFMLSSSHNKGIYKFSFAHQKSINHFVSRDLFRLSSLCLCWNQNIQQSTVKIFWLVNKYLHLIGNYAYTDDAFRADEPFALCAIKSDRWTHRITGVTAVGMSSARYPCNNYHYLWEEKYTSSDKLLTFQGRMLVAVSCR